MKSFILVPVLLAVTATTACSRDASNNSNHSAVLTNQVSDAPTSNAANQVAPANQSAQAPQPGSMQVVLGREALMTGQVGLHPGTTIAFGAPKAEVVSAISAIRGQPTGTGRNNECPSGAVDFAAWGALTAHFENDRFAGWVVDGETSPALNDDRGLAVGARRNELDGDAEITPVPDSSLGTEISVDGIGAILESAAPNARIKTLFSGVTCFAR